MDRPTQDHHLVITNDGTVPSTAEIIRAIADPLIAAGASNLDVRAAVAQQTGLGIGGGGAGASDDPACPYCGATGGGGHGGLCPNGGTP